jgi:ABC-2 type transport system permease protein
VAHRDPALPEHRIVTLYWRVARTAFRRHATYRAATLASVVENSVVSMLRAFVYLAVVHQRGVIRGLTPQQAVTFAFIAGAIEAGFRVTADTEIDERIRTGDIVTDLYRPADFQSWWFANEAGRASFMLVARGLPPFLFGLAVFDLLLPRSVVSVLLFAASLALAFVISFAYRFLVSLSGFWMIDTRGVNSLAAGVLTVASGALLPLALFPTALGRVLRALPFASIIQTPFDIFAGNRAAAPLLLAQAAWAVALVVIGRVVLARAVARVVVQGG